MTKETKAAEVTKIKSGRIKSRVNYDVTLKYDKRDFILAPRQEISIPDFSKLDAFNPREVLKIEG